MTKFVATIAPAQQSRGSLGEGRSFGLGFGFAKKITDTKFQLIMPITACKDYLNDIVYTEATKKSMSAYGLVTKVYDCFDEFAWLVIQILPFNISNKPYPSMDTDIKALTSNVKHLEKLLRHVDSQFKIPVKLRTRIYSTEEGGVYLIRVPLLYVKATYLISLYTLIARFSIYYDGSIPPAQYLDSFKSGSDASMWANAKPKFLRMLAEGLPEQNLHSITHPSSANVHNVGIVSFNWPQIVK
jgi:hypothetical protein